MRSTATCGLRDDFAIIPADVGQQSGIITTRRKSFARQGDILAIFLIRLIMSEKTLSIFVDESGNFGYPDKVSHYYVIGLVLHNQDASIQSAVADLDLALRDMHISHHCIHAGPMSVNPR